MAIAPCGAMFEISVADLVRTHRHECNTAIQAARFLQQRKPGAKIV